MGESPYVTPPEWMKREKRKKNLCYLIIIIRVIIFIERAKAEIMPEYIITTYIKDTWKSPSYSASYGEVQKISPGRQSLRNITINEVQHSNWQHIHRLF